MARARKSKAKGGPEHTIALPCVILAIDPGKTSGWALYLEGRPVRWGSLNAGDSAAVQQVLLDACELAQFHRLPLVLLGETWNVGGSHGSPAMWQGLGAAWGAWKLAAEHLSSSRRNQPGALGPQLVASRILRVSTSTWRARFGMMRAPKDAPKDWYKAMALQVVQQQLGVEVEPEHHDAAEALLIGLWGTRSSAVGKKLPARVMKARGFAMAQVAACLALALALAGCATTPPPPDHRATDLGECVGLAATLVDVGPPVAHVYAYPNGHPCGDGGACRQGVCTP